MRNDEQIFNGGHLKLDRATDKKKMYVFYFEACYIKPWREAE